MSEKQNTDRPIKTTAEGVVIKWKTLVAVLAVIMGVGGGTPVLTAYLGIGGSASAEEFKKHESEQARQLTGISDRVLVCEEAIGIMAKTVKAVETVQRMQVATTEARNLTIKIKNPDEREKQFVRILGINLKRLGADPPRETCYTLDCTN